LAALALQAHRSTAFSATVAAIGKKEVQIGTCRPSLADPFVTLLEGRGGNKEPRLDVGMGPLRFSSRRSGGFCSGARAIEEADLAGTSISGR